MATHMMELAAEQALDRAQETVALLTLGREHRDAASRLPAATAGGYSTTRGLRALAEGQSLSRAAPLEYEASMRVAERLGREPHPGCMFLPTPARRDLTAGNATAGGYLVSTQAHPGLVFVDALRAAMVVMRMGMPTVQVDGPNVQIPRYTGATTTYWLTSEGAGPTEAQGTLGQIVASPKTVGAYTEMSRQLLVQTGQLVDTVILRELANSVAAAGDQAVLQGTGATGQPQGIVGTTGVGSVTGASIAYAGLAEFQTDVLTSNASVMPESFGYVTTPAVAGTLANRQRFTGTDSPLWGGALVDGVVVGRKAMATSSCPASTIVAGDWSQAVLLDWGGVEVGVNPYAADQAAYRAGLVGLRCFWSVDVVLLRPAAFSVASSVT